VIHSSPPDVKVSLNLEVFSPLDWNLFLPGNSSLSSYLLLTMQSLSLTSFFRNSFPKLRLYGLKLLQKDGAIHATTRLPKPEPLAVGKSLQGLSGKIYEVKKILLDRDDSPWRVYKARCVTAFSNHVSSPSLTATSSSDDQDFVLKDVPASLYDDQKELQQSMASCPNLRTLVDSIVDSHVVVYPFMTSDLLELSGKKSFTKHARKSVLQQALRGLVALHEKNIIHTGE
jgi:serine/threonine protein kinase